MVVRAGTPPARAGLLYVRVFSPCRVIFHKGMTLGKILVLAALGLGLASSAAQAQAAKTLQEQLVGTWNFVIAEVVTADGNKTLPWWSSQSLPGRTRLSAPAGLHFHDLRHSHKTWLIEDDVPEVAVTGLGPPGIRPHLHRKSPPHRCSPSPAPRWSRT